MEEFQMAQPEDEKTIAGWYALDVELETLAREAAEYAWMEAGSVGTETNDAAGKLLRVTGYFDNAPERERVRAELATALRIYDVSSSAVRDMNVRRVENRDWLAGWKQNWQPVVAGRFIILPPWSEIKPLHDQLLIRIEPRMAFGTGTPETTRLCLGAIEKNFAGVSFLAVW